MLLDSADRILLFRLENRRTGNTWWATPGGGVEKGEKSVEAARRELREETGIDAAGFEGPVWIADHWFRTEDELVHQEDRYFLVRVARPDVDTSGQDALEAGLMVEHRWWSLDELDATDARVYPVGLGGLVRDLVANGVPEKPLWLGERPGVRSPRLPPA